MKGTERLFGILAAAAVILAMAGMMSCSAPWWAGHDNGEAYDHYQESMKKYIDENGFEQDIYGYGW